MKKASVVFYALLLVLLTGSAMAQEWSAEQKEVIAHIKACFDAETRALQEKNPELWLAAFPCEQDAHHWVASQGAPEQLMESRTRIYAEGLTWRLKKVNWLDVRPLSVKIDGDVALVHFYDNWIIEDYQGKISQLENKKFLVFRKKSGRWTYLGGMSAQ